ncbi:MAG: hypothetical protein IJ937_13665 [Treponema sp.]|nr:hypothetical protein [Treponema sp.]
MGDICGYVLDKEATTKRFFDICDFYGIKNKDLVQLFEVSNTTVSYWRNGYRFPDWNKLMLFAYTVGLPLDVMIIGKKSLEDKQIEESINKINKLREKKYILKLQELLDNGDLDSQPNIEELILNPLCDNQKILDSDNISYSKLLADVRYYGLKKNTTSKKNINDTLSSKSETNIVSIQEKNLSEDFALNLNNQISILSAQEEYPSKISLSKYLQFNNQSIQIFDKFGNPLNGCTIDDKAYDIHSKIIILRFRNGYLDGDEFDESGNYVATRPAVETFGHIEYWREGYIHRDAGEAAIISNGFKTYEYWENGKQVK